MENDPDEEEMDDVNIYDERECHWRNVFKENEGGVDDKKSLLHAKRWDLCVNEKEKLVKGKYLVEVIGHDKKKVIREVVDDNVIGEPSDHEYIGLRGFDFNIFDEDEDGVVREGCSEPYLKMLIKIWPGGWISQLKRINQKVDDENGKVLNKGNLRYQKVCSFSSNELWRNIGCLISEPTFGLGRSRMW